MSPEAAPFRVLVIGGVETRFHHFAELGPALTRVITGGTGRASHVANQDCQVTSLLATDALRPEVLRNFDALVSITTGGTLSEGQEHALLGAVAEPRNDRARPLHFLGVHGASCSFTDNPRYLAMLGGRFLRHPPMATFRVEIAAERHPVTNGVSAFEIYDEQYVLEILSDVRVLLSAAHAESAPSAARLPLGWVRKHGEGKVCYLALGHGPEQLEHPSCAALINQALAWFARSSA